MKKAKKLYVLLGVLAILIAAAFGINRIEEHQEKIKTSEEVIISVPTEDFTEISWQYDDVSLAFHKDGQWLYNEDEAFPVSEEIMEDLLSHFNEFGVSFKIEDVDDYSQYGLDEPVCNIYLSTADASYEIKLGAFSNLDSKRYVSIGDGNVYLVNNDPYDYFAVELSDMIQNDEKLSYTDIKSLSFAGEENYSVNYIENSTETWCADDVYFKKMGAKNLPLDTSAVESYVKTVSRLDFSNYASYNVSDEELKTFGLDEPELTATVIYSLTNGDNITDGSYTFSIAQEPAQKAEWNEKTANGEVIDEETTAYLRIGESQIVYCLSSANYEALMAYKYNDLRHADLFSADLGDAYKMVFTLEGKEYSFEYGEVTAETEDETTAESVEETSEEKTAEEETSAIVLTANTAEDKDCSWFYNGDSLSAISLTSCIKALTSTVFTDEAPGDIEEISFTVYLANENYPEITVTLYRYDGSNCLAVINGESIALISRSSAVDLIEALNSIVL